MAAKSKKRLSKIDNKLLKLEKLELKDVICSICQSILIEPVTLPCFHDFCQNCFNGSVENNALCCPLCRLRIGSWLRTATKQKRVVNTKLWDFIKSKFHTEIKVKLRGEDLNLRDETPALRLSKPGEIREEYEAELRRLRAEHEKLEQKHLHETEQLIRKLQKEEEEAHKKYLEKLKQDELLAKELQGDIQTNSSNNIVDKSSNKKKKLKTTKLDSYVMRKTAFAKLRDSPLLTDDNTSIDSTTPKKECTPHLVPPDDNVESPPSPELVPSYSKYLKSFLEKKIHNVTGLWNKENGRSVKFDSQKQTSHKEGVSQEIEPKSSTSMKKCVQSLPVSLPYKGILQFKKNLPEIRTAETDSIDSMRQELCFFKPIESTTPTSFKSDIGSPLKVPVLRTTPTKCPQQSERTPSRSQYLDSLCHLRHLSLSQNLPSAFVIALNILRVECPSKHSSLKIKKNSSLRSGHVTPLPLINADQPTMQSDQVDPVTILENKTTLRRTRSMGWSTNQTTPKKGKSSPVKKFYSRSCPKKSKNERKVLLTSPLTVPDVIINKTNAVVKNLTSPLKNNDVKILLEEQLRIEKLIEQEKNDLELARKMDAELNGRKLRRSSVKRQVTLNYALRPAKKLKV